MVTIRLKTVKYAKDIYYTETLIRIILLKKLFITLFLTQYICHHYLVQVSEDEGRTFFFVNKFTVYVNICIFETRIRRLKWVSLLNNIEIVVIE